MAARISYRTPRYGRANPGRKHLRGSDVTARMQRQYEHILDSLRQSRRYRSDKKRKQVAAATVRELAQHNPWLGGDGAERLAEEFHGRPVRDVIEIDEREEYDDEGAVLGELQTLQILLEDGRHTQTIEFDWEPDSEDNILVVGDPAGQNIEFVGGDQRIDWEEVEGASESQKNLILVGPVAEIEYFADKHHLSGPKIQKKGITYYHELGEDDGELPYLVYDRRNCKLLFVGGDYTIEPEGITG